MAEEDGGRLERLQNQLYQAISQNIKLYSILEIATIPQVNLSLDTVWETALLRLEEALPGHSAGLLLEVEQEWKIYFRKDGIPTRRQIPNPQIQPDYRDPRLLIDPQNPANAFEEKILRIFEENELKPGRHQGILCLPFFRNERETFLGFLFIFSGEKALARDEIRLLEVTQKQFWQILQNHYLFSISHTDPLTGLYNRRHLESALEYEIKRARRKDYPLGLIFVDLDYFKKINDRFGHARGDQVLVQTAEILVESLREMDIACRLGGEEFVILLPDTNLRDIESITRRLQKNIANHSFHHKQEVFHVTASFGYGYYKSAIDLDYSQFLERIDRALYQAKEGGRNRIVQASEY